MSRLAEASPFLHTTNEEKLVFSGKRLYTEEAKVLMEEESQGSFDREIDAMLTRHRRTTVSEPEGRYIDDPPGKTLALQ